MSTELHDCHQVWWQQEQKRWARSGILTSAEDDHLRFQVGTTVKFQEGHYPNPHKEPDLLIRPKGVSFPTGVMKSGWSESSMRRLQDDMKLWLVGGNGAVHAVLLLKWTKVTGTNSVKGEVELYTRNNQDTPILQHTETVSPVPPQTNSTQQITLTMGMVFGSGILPGSNPNHQLTLEIVGLRGCAAEAMGRMGLVPV
ncbi:hypothetical protein AJ80_02330 [Polytolypa hystricis UAMH7299]|uniref:Uncharacterized protein n=1 Tax=Polytolypa hystricis (strain UAMH7299) TaxID=1447883 RepID=A0A2B7YQV1_POLH7|nr:hypothetical protein AJ80_02330 [Polytolypa hystricis UAMH7299]